MTDQQRPSTLLQAAINEGRIARDERQLAIAALLDDIFIQLIKANQRRQSPLRFITPKKRIKGLYLWGLVGTGKSFLTDLFFNALPFSNKKRLHFHAFMQQVHLDLKQLQGTKDPLKKLASRMARDTQLLCFDEFFVTDIADAMLLGGLFQALFAEGVCLVTNSNCSPDELYKNGMLRERFLPAIECIKQNTRVYHLESEHDYRLRHLLEAGVYFTPLNKAANEEMYHCFKYFSKGKAYEHTPITILKRSIDTKQHSPDVIWFEFEKICGKPRSQNDYLELVKTYHTILVSDVRVMGEREEDIITCFIKLVDVLYDARVRLVLSAETCVENLYPKGPLSFAFQRTCSRLIEMQSTDYFDEQLVDQI